MIVQMIYQMSGGRYDDRTWPLPWHDFEVPDDEGRGLIRCGAAMEVVGTIKAPAGTPATPADPGKAAVAPSPPRVSPELADPAPAKAPAEVEMPQPAPGDPKSDWVDYAVSRGAARAEADERTKTQLQAVYGGRL